MARIELSDGELLAATRARIVLDEAPHVAMTDLVATARLVGRLTATVESLLAIVEGGES